MPLLLDSEFTKNVIRGVEERRGGVATPTPTTTDKVAWVRWGPCWEVMAIVGEPTAPLLPP